MKPTPKLDFKKSMALFAVLTCAQYGHAGMGDWLSSDSDAAVTEKSSQMSFFSRESASDDTKEDMTNKKAEENTSVELGYLDESPKSQNEKIHKEAMIAKDENVVLEQSDSVEEQSPVNSGMATIALEKNVRVDDPAPRQRGSAQVSGGEEEQMASVQNRMESLMSKAQSFLSKDVLSGLTANQNMAINIFNSALMQIGIEKISNTPLQQNSLNLYNQSVGCINASNSPKLLQLSNQLIDKYTEEVNISDVVQKGYKIGGDHKAKCY